MNTTDEKTCDVDEKTCNGVEEKVTCSDLLKYTQKEILAYVTHLLNRDYLTGDTTLPCIHAGQTPILRPLIDVYEVLITHLLEDTEAWKKTSSDVITKVITYYLSICGNCVENVLEEQENTEWYRMASRDVKKQYRQLTCRILKMKKKPLWQIANICMSALAGITRTENYQFGTMYDIILTLYPSFMTDEYAIKKISALIIDNESTKTYDEIYNSSESCEIRTIMYKFIRSKLNRLL